MCAVQNPITAQITKSAGQALLSPLELNKGQGKSCQFRDMAGLDGASSEQDFYKVDHASIINKAPALIADA
jgi:hypothetical protein